MGGGYYDRDVYHALPRSSGAAAAAGYSGVSDERLGHNKQIDKSLDPKNYGSVMLRSDFKHPIVFALDVTGSMGDWAKIIYDKLPMFYGQIMTQKYLTDPAISFCAIGDHISDYAPLQVSKFGQGREIDKNIEKVWLEGGGGGGFTESYELAAYFYVKRVSLVYQEIPFFFVTGDEKYYSKIESETVKALLGKEPSEFKVNADVMWEELKMKYNVFYLHKEYDVPRKEAQIIEQWTNILGPERILKVNTAKACVDVILGAIALTSGARNLEQYLDDMKKRDQEDERIEEVKEALEAYAAKVDQLAIRRGRVGGAGEDGKEEEKKIEADGGMENVRDILKPHLDKMGEEKDERA